jgi:hypothetical protein
VSVCSYDSLSAMFANLYKGGHVHDGGTNVTTYVGNREICNSVVTYGGKPEDIESPNSKMGPGMAHISNDLVCNMMGTLNKDDPLHVQAFYNMQEHMPMKNVKGELSQVMGIAILYVAMPFTAADLA